MHSFIALFAKITPVLTRVALISVMLGVPLFAAPVMSSTQGPVIEAPAPKKMGAGFVLLMSLQRH